MKDNLQKFRQTSAFEATFFLMKKVWKGQSLLYIIYTIALFGLMFLTFFKAFGLDFEKIMSMNNPNTIFNPGANTQLAEELVMNVKNNIPILIIGFLLLWLLSSVYYTLTFKMNESYIKENSINNELLFSNFTNNVFKIFGLSFVLTMIFLAIYFAVVLFIVLIAMIDLLMLSILIGIVVFVLFLLLIARFSLSFSSLIHGNFGIIESLQYSFKNISFKRAALSILFVFVFFVGTFFVLMIFQLMIASLGMVGAVLYMIVNVALNLLLTLFIVSAMTVLYYRYSNDEIDENIQDHLIQ